jgi:hypothetical protein
MKKKNKLKKYVSKYDSDKYEMKIILKFSPEKYPRS